MEWKWHNATDIGSQNMLFLQFENNTDTLFWNDFVINVNLIFNAPNVTKLGFKKKDLTQIVILLPRMPMPED